MKNRRYDGRLRVSAGYLGLGLLTIAAMLIVAPFLNAQLHPMPGSKDDPAVHCTGCAGTNYHGERNDGLKTYPYSPPIKRHVGRYVDSTSTASFQAPLGFRTARARYIRTVPTQRGAAPPRVYVVIGSAIVAYDLNKFFTETLAKPVSIGSISGLGKVQGGRKGERQPAEAVAKWDGMVYPDARTSPGWSVPGQDKQDNIGPGAPMDFDDRGYIYAAYTYTGWGIAKDDGRTGSGAFPTIVQLISGGGSGITKADTSGVGPESIVSVKVGATYYAITAGGSKEAVWDVTDPVAPKLLLTRSAPTFGVRRFDRNDQRGHVAIITARKQLRVYAYSDFLTRNPIPVYENSSPFADLSYDEAGNLWAAEQANRVWRFAPTDRGYTAAAYAPHAGRFDHLAMHAAGGYIFVQGRDHTGGLAFDARSLKIDAGGLRNVELDGFFRKYYHRAPAGYAQPAGYNSPEVMGDVQVVTWGGKTYLMYSTVGLGDVFEIDGGGPGGGSPPPPPPPPPPPCSCPCPCAAVTVKGAGYMRDALAAHTVRRHQSRSRFLRLSMNGV